MARLFRIKVKPNQPQTKILSEAEGELLIAISQPAEKGRANRELLRFLKSHFKAERVEIISGFSSRKKVVRVL